MYGEDLSLDEPSPELDSQTDDLLDENLDEGMDLGDDYFGESEQTPVSKHADLLKSLTDFSPYLKHIVNTWLGVTWNEEEGKYVTNPLIKPTMNPLGAAWCAGVLRTYIRGNNIITDIGEEQYKQIMSDHIESTCLNLGTRDDFGIKEDGDFLRVLNEMEHSVSLILMGAGDGKYNKFLQTTIHRNESVNTNADGMGYPTPMRKPQQDTMGRVKKMFFG